MSHWLVYDCQERKTYLSGFRSWEGSVLCKKSLIKNETKYLSTSKGEDTSLIMYLIRKGQVASTFYPSLYIYVYHGANVWDREHWSGIMKLGNQLSTEFSKMIGNILEGRYSHNKASELLDQHLLFDPDV